MVSSCDNLITLFEYQLKLIYREKLI